MATGHARSFSSLMMTDCYIEVVFFFLNRTLQEVSYFSDLVKFEKLWIKNKLAIMGGGILLKITFLGRAVSLRIKSLIHEG